MCSGFCDTAFMEVVDPVRILHGGESMGDGYDGEVAVVNDVVNGGLDDALALGVECRGG
jgi:hypothetical protein